MGAAVADVKNKRPRSQPLRCPFCGAGVKLEDNIKIYRSRSYGKAYICDNFPTCDTYVGVHKDTNKPLGTLANKELRTLRMKCHEVFDPLWKSGRMSRSRAYRVLSDIMSMDVNRTHIGMFNIDQCRWMLRQIDKLRMLEDDGFENVLGSSTRDAVGCGG